LNSFAGSELLDFEHFDKWYTEQFAEEPRPGAPEALFAVGTHDVSEKNGKNSKGHDQTVRCLDWLEDTCSFVPSSTRKSSTSAMASQGVSSLFHLYLPSRASGEEKYGIFLDLSMLQILYSTSDPSHWPKISTELQTTT
jgi:hypothetical protein